MPGICKYKDSFSVLLPININVAAWVLVTRESTLLRNI